MDYEIIISENATKLDAFYSGLGPYSQRFVARSNILFQMDKNISKLLLVRDLSAKCESEIHEYLLINKTPKSKTGLLAKKLLDEIKIPDWDIKQQILKKRKKEIEKILNKNYMRIKRSIEKLLGYKLRPFKIFLTYSAENKGIGGCAPKTKENIIMLRLCNNSKFDNLSSLIAHELMHMTIKDKKERKIMYNITNAVEEAIFDIIMKKIDVMLGKKIIWDKEIKIDLENRDGQHKEYIYEIYEMLKPILTGKDDLIWKYIDWNKLKKIKLQKC